MLDVGFYFVVQRAPLEFASDYSATGMCKQAVPYRRMLRQSNCLQSTATCDERFVK
jgi:hypothetical protein